MALPRSCPLKRETIFQMRGRHGENLFYTRGTFHYLVTVAEVTRPSTVQRLCPVLPRMTRIVTFIWPAF